MSFDCRTLMKAAALGALVASMSACASEPVPADVHGTWRTDAPGYEDRTMRISPDSVWFSGADGALTAFPVRDARVGEDEVLLEYGEGRATYVLSLVRVSEGLSLRNQPEITWSRTEN